MANHSSAEKRNRQRLVRTERARSVRSATRTAVKQARVALAAGETDEAKGKVHAASVELARAAKKGVLHPRTAARSTARINAALHKLVQAK